MYIIDLPPVKYFVLFVAIQHLWLKVPSQKMLFGKLHSSLTKSPKYFLFSFIF